MVCVCVCVREREKVCEWSFCILPQSQSTDKTPEVAGGTDLIQKLEANILANTSIERLVWIDAHGYDGFPAFSCLAGAGQTSISSFCCTICHKTKKSHEYLNQLIMDHAYEQARLGHLQLDGFPNFEPVVQELQQHNDDQSQNNGDESYKVTSPIDGALVIKAAIIDQFKNMPDFDEVVSQHNEHYNPDGRVATEVNRESQASPVKKPVMLMAEVVKMEPEDVMTREKLASLVNPPCPCLHAPACANLPRFFKVGTQ